MSVATFGEMFVFSSALKNFPTSNLELPQLPSGYPGCFGLAAIPPLWFKVMDPKLLAWADNDLSKINIDPAAREKVYRKYGQRAATVSVSPTSVIADDASA